MPAFRCRDIGLKCGFEVKSDTREELMNAVTGHAERIHHWKPIPPETLEKIRKAIRK